MLGWVLFQRLTDAEIPGTQDQNVKLTFCADVAAEELAVVAVLDEPLDDPQAASAPDRPTNSNDLIMTDCTLRRGRRPNRSPTITP